MGDMKKKLIRITTVPISLEKLLENQLKYMSDFYEVKAVSSEEKRLQEFGKSQGVDIFYLDLTRKITPLKDLKAVIKLYKFLKREKPFIVHSHTPKAGIVGMMASYFAGIPNRLHTVAGMPLLEARGLRRVVLNAVEVLTYKFATRVYPNSYGLKEIIVKSNFTKEKKLRIIGNGSSNGIDTTYFNSNLYSDQAKNELKESLAVSKKDFVFIFVGRIVRDKGINELIEAFNKLSSITKDVKLLLVGSYEDDLDPLEKETISIINRNRNIISVGFQKDVRPYFAISNALVFPSYREGFPNVVMQASAMGLPSIVSNINGCNEIIINNFNGKIIPVKDPNSLFEEMQFFIQNSSILGEYGSNARSKIKEGYERKLYWKKLLEEYKRIEDV